MIETARGAEPRLSGVGVVGVGPGVADQAGAGDIDGDSARDSATGEAATRRRARPMAPEDRRREILQAVIPLLRQKGLDISTREIAQAADVAEGTVFRIFADKKALFTAAMDVVLDPAELESQIAQVEADDLGDLVWSIIQILVNRTRDVGQIMGPLRGTDPMTGRRLRSRSQLGPIEPDHAGPHGQGGHHDPRHIQARFAAIGQRVHDAIGHRLEPFGDELGLDVDQTASVIMSCSFVVSHPIRLANLDAATLTTVLLNGVRCRPDPWSPG